MPMATAVPFSPNAEVSQAFLRDCESGSYTILQALSPGNTDVVQLGASQNRISSDAPYLSIIEQPKSKWRYRYQSEKGSHGPLPGCTSIPSKKTFPAVKVMNMPEDLDIFVKASLWTTDKDPSLHVHKLFGLPCSADGTCTVKVNEDGIAVFQDITILFVAKKDVPNILFERMVKEGKYMGELGEQQLKKLAADRAKSINLNYVRICFEAIWFNRDKTESRSLCHPEFSTSVANLRSTKDGDLKICRMSAYKGFAAGGDEVFLLCCKVDKKDIQVRFFEPSSSWESFGKFTEADVHQQCAIVFQTPPYHRRDITDSVKVSLQLQRKNGDCSDPMDFIYIPNDPDEERITKKRKKNCMYPEFNESKSDINKTFGAQNISRTFAAQTSNAIVQDQSSPLGSESMNDSSLGSACSSEVYSNEQLGDLPTPTLTDCYDMTDLDFFMKYTESSDIDYSERLLKNSDPVFSQVNVPEVPNWNLRPVDPVLPIANPYYKTDAAVVSIMLPEGMMNQSSIMKDVVCAKSEEVEEAFSKLSISGRSTALTGNSSSGTANNQKQDTEETSKDEQNTSTVAFPKAEQIQTKTVSDSSLKKIWYSLCVALKKQNPFDFLRHIPQVIGFSDEFQNTLLHVAVSLEPPCHFIIESLLKTAKEASCPLVNYTNKDCKTPLHVAVKAKNPSTVRLLLKYGADPTLTDKQGFSSYHWAICIKSKECLDELLQQMNCNSSAERSHLDSTDYCGLAPLHYAVRGELIDCITLLCVHGADVNIRSKKDGRTPLHYAALQDSRVAKILFSEKILDVNTQDYGGNTPLHLACSSNNPEVVRMLMSYGADPSISNYEMDGVTAFGYAESNEEIKRILTSRCYFKEQHDLNFRETTSCTSSRSKMASPGNSLCVSKDSGRSLASQYACAKSGYAATTQSDSGYISGGLSLLNDDLLQKLSRLLDPPSDSWRNLMMCTIMDDDFEKSIHKLTSSPTRAIITTFLNNGGTTETFLTALEAAALHEAQDIVLQYISQECT